MGMCCGASHTWPNHGRVLEVAMHTDQHAVTDRVAERVFPRAPEQVGRARRWAASVYADAGADPDACYLLVSEVATNAVIHATGADFTVRIHQDELWIELWDGSPVEPQRRQARPDSEGGRGLELLDLMAPGYEVVLGTTGKCVCFQPKLG
ncbi:ATP-binding protein [Streptomyces sp. NPDC057002]|uniref:ATP-binding protein n=1 Tax=Streptomyces sp. NPDC057002 TaxID=3345992 RepID=UPI003636481C